MSRLRLALSLAALVSALTPAVASAATDPNPVTPVPKLDVSKYLGTWRQIAAKPQWFEAACKRDVYAKYLLNADGSVRVTNTCSGPFSQQIKTVGKAKILDTTTNAQLQVSFVDLFGTWIYQGSAPNYVVVGLGANYDWAVVGDPARQSGFVLSRTASLTADQRAAATAALVKNGFDPCTLQITPQTGGATTAGTFC